MILRYLGVAALLLSFVVHPSLLHANSDTIPRHHPLISPEDRQAEDQSFRQQLSAERAREAQARKEWRQMSQAERKASPWTNWYRKTFVPAILQLASLRKKLFHDNLFDTYLTRPAPPSSCTAADRMNRRVDGSCNDLNDPLMGSVWTRLGRNISPDKSHTDEAQLFSPNPRTLSRELLARDQFKPVGFLNLLAVGWIQFMTHDWFSHGDNEDPAHTAPYFLPLAAGDPLGSEMIIPKSREDRTRTDEENRKLPRTYLNESTHWWDGSQLYGAEDSKANELRAWTDGLLKVEQDGFIPRNLFGIEKVGISRNWWIGLDLMHHIFVHEHNAIAGHLKQSYPSMSDQQLFDKARMVNAALMAKIHTVEWTPAILPNRTLREAMFANWKGLINGSYRVHPWFELFPNDVLFGIVGGKKELNDVPYAMTEEFVSVYRMHPLLPDQLSVRSSKDDSVVQSMALLDARESAAGTTLHEHGLQNWIYSFGRMNPGALTLNNYPGALQSIDIPLAGKVDLGAIDIFRDRERGVPRYNEFRRQVKLKPLKSFDQLTNDPALNQKIASLYENDVEKLDLLVGCLAESQRPTGYGFGETAFQIFIIQASRRLLTDRFYTDSYNAETYTKEGILWVDNNNFKTVLLRHFPELRPALFGVKNAFNPWNAVKK